MLLKGPLWLKSAEKKIQADGWIRGGLAGPRLGSGKISGWIQGLGIKIKQACRSFGSDNLINHGLAG